MVERGALLLCLLSVKLVVVCRPSAAPSGSVSRGTIRVYPSKYYENSVPTSLCCIGRGSWRPLSPAQLTHARTTRNLLQTIAYILGVPRFWLNEAAGGVFFDRVEFKILLSRVYPFFSQRGSAV